MKTIITTVGTSVFTNLTKKGKNEAIKDRFGKLEQKQFSEWIEYEIRVINDRGKSKGLKSLVSNAISMNPQASAEIKSILKIAKDEQVKVHLLATDTILSVLAAEIVKEWFDGHKEKIQVEFKRPQKLESQDGSEYVVSKLSVEKNQEYQEGFMNLVRVVSDVIDRSKKGKVILNITGGYKAIVPIMTLMGQIKNVPLKYIYNDDYEDGNRREYELVEIGNLPISFDWGIVEALKPFLNVEDITFWNGDRKRLLAALHDGGLYLDEQSNNFKASENCKHLSAFLQGKDLRIINHLLELKLVTRNCQVTALGVLFQKIQELDNRRGYQMEYILYNYFARSKERKAQEVSEYSATTLIDLPGSFRFVDGRLETRDGTPGKNGWRKIGDVDISLKNENTYVLGESKAFSKFCSYDNEVKQSKYSEQIFARLQRFAEVHKDKINSREPSLEFLMIVFDFQFKGFERPVLAREKASEVASSFKEKLGSLEVKLKGNDGDKEFKPNVTFLGLKCLIDLNHKNITANYTSFYQDLSFKWESL